ncbi:ATP F0F1 synthase synthase [Salinivibrio sp. MA351]|uniref:ATP F0F1 synthase synthase n=1 Tax=Salinivibrio sp. MA351 TaxID=1909453 RepID=UPI0009891722|nr:ATP F0F1 synthase synthase [Salinivibrio sp. MA351]OOF00224.1 ATP F0F1 synthase synthase [Salinivibrio sp. MA351]
MDHVLAKVKRLRKKPHRKIISDSRLFDRIQVNVDACVAYDPDHNLDEDAWFKVERFSQQDFCPDIFRLPFDSKDYDDLEKAQFEDIICVISVQYGDFYLQKVSPSLFIHRKTITFGEAAEIEESGHRLVIKDKPDAVYLRQEDTLIFTSLATISSIFKGIDILYKEATDQEVEDFLDKDFIDLSDDYNVDDVSKPNRKRIALAMDTLNRMEADERTQIIDYINSYCDQKLRFDEDNEKFEIRNDEELKYLLYGIEQRFYTTPLSRERRLANSVQSMD